MPFTICQGNIADVSADVFVNDANNRLSENKGVCEALFSGAGRSKMRQACAVIGYCSTGHVVTTPGFDLPCLWVVHAVGPIWQGGDHDEESRLRECYRSVFAEVERLGANSVAYPLISSGNKEYPLAEALRIAREETSAFLDRVDGIDVTLVFPERSVLKAVVGNMGILPEPPGEAISKGALAEERADSCERYSARFCTRCGTGIPEQVRFCMKCGAPVRAAPTASDLFAASSSYDAALSSQLPREPSFPVPTSVGSRGGFRLPNQRMAEKGQAVEGLEDALRNLDASFSTTFLAMIDERGLTDSQVYKRANISRQLFSKIRSNPDYRPTKPTAIALGLALRLSVDELQQLLACAGLTLSRSSAFDVIVEFFIKRGDYDIFRINEALFAFDQPLLGSF